MSTQSLFELVMNILSVLSGIFFIRALIITIVAWFAFTIWNSKRFTVDEKQFYGQLVLAGYGALPFLPLWLKGVIHFN